MQISTEKYETLMDEIAHLRSKQPKWISVKDRLPNIAQPVLAYSGEELGIGFAYLYSDGKWYGDCGDVTHWMPLPEPPKMEKKHE